MGLRLEFEIGKYCLERKRSIEKPVRARDKGGGGTRGEEGQGRRRGKGGGGRGGEEGRGRRRE